MTVPRTSSRPTMPAAAPSATSDTEPTQPVAIGNTRIRRRHGLVEVVVPTNDPRREPD